jgi:SPP1 family predicted phage head-tail adaptor
MDIGRMDRLITIQTPTITYNTEGSPSKSWSTGYQVWGEVIQKGGREIFRHEQVSAEADTIFRIYYNTTVIPDRTQRVVYNSTNYNIMDVRELGYGERWEIMAKATPAV